MFLYGISEFFLEFNHEATVFVITRLIQKFEQNFLHQGHGWDGSELKEHMRDILVDRMLLRDDQELITDLFNVLRQD